MNKSCKRLILGFSVAGALLSSCSETVYVTQQGQTYNDYKAVKHEKVVNKTKKPKVRSRH